MGNANTTHSTLGSRLKMLRLQQGWYQEDVANQFGIAKSSVGMYERDERSPNKELLKEFAKFYNVSVDYLLGETDYPDTIDEKASKLKDLNAFLEQSSVMFKGKMLSESEKRRVQDVLTALFWESFNIDPNPAIDRRDN